MKNNFKEKLENLLKEKTQANKKKFEIELQEFDKLVSKSIQNVEFLTNLRDNIFIPISDDLDGAFVEYDNFSVIYRDNVSAYKNNIIKWEKIYKDKVLSGKGVSFPTSLGYFQFNYQEKGVKYNSKNPVSFIVFRFTTTNETFSIQTKIENTTQSKLFENSDCTRTFVESKIFDFLNKVIVIK